MFTDELKVIRKAEERADALKKESKLEAKKMVQDANEEALRIVAEAETQAKERYEALVAEGQKIADDEYDKAIKNVNKEADKLEQKAMTCKDETVQFIAERIVSLSVNR